MHELLNRSRSSRQLSERSSGKVCSLSGAVSTLRVSSAILAASIAAWGGLCPAPVSAAGGGEPEAPTRGYLSLDYVAAYFEFEADLSRRVVRSKDSRGGGRKQRQTNLDWGFKQRLGLQLGGAIIDPSFITYGGDLSFALTQDHFEEDIGSFEQTDTDRGHLLQYDLRLNFFSGRRLSGSIHGLRRDDRIDRRFQPTLDERRTGFGTIWVFSHHTFPMELSYDYLETDRTGNRNDLDDEHFTDSTLRYRVRWLISPHHQAKFSYEHSTIKQEYQGLSRPFETTRDLFTIEDELTFGPEHEHELVMLVHWQEESGDFARDFLEIGPHLTLRHNENLQTRYSYQFNRERFEGLDVESQRLDFQLIHQVYTNLTTTVGAFALCEDVEDDINTTQYGTSVDWQYNRKNPFGHLYANLAVAYDTEDVDGDNGRRLVLDEPHTFRDPIAVTLRNRNVVPIGMLVTDSTNRRLLRRGIDYAVLRNGNVTRLVRIRSGRIADGDTVLVDYQYETPMSGRLDTVRVDFSIEQKFSNGLRPYYRLSYRNQEDDSSFGFARRADRTNHHRLGVSYETKRYSLGAEYEIFDDTIEPYDAFHLNGLLHVIRNRDHTVDFSTRFSRLFFEGGFDNRNVTLIDVALDHRRRLTESLSTIERAAYRFERDSAAGDTHGWDVTAGLEYVVGDLSGELTFEYDRLELPDSEEDDFGVYFRVRREIPNVLARR